jgi:hypothetical protein
MLITRLLTYVILSTTKRVNQNDTGKKQCGRAVLYVEDSHELEKPNTI